MAQVGGGIGPDQLTIDHLHDAQTLVLPGTCTQPERSEGRRKRKRGR